MDAVSQPELISTGIGGFDEFIGGGLYPGTAILLIAPPAMETHFLCLEYIYGGVTRDEPGLIVTMNYSPEELKTRIIPYGWILARGEQKGILRWVDGYSLNAKKDVQSTDTIKRIGGSIALSDLTIGVIQAQRDFHTKSEYYRFAFDSLSTLFIYNDANTVYRFLRAVMPKLRISGGTGFFLLGRGMHDSQIEMTLRYMVDGAIEIDEDMNMKILSLPTPTNAKSAHLSLTKSGFKVDIDTSP